MLEYAINNETMRGANLPPFLTDNLIYWRYDVMAGKTIPESEIIGKKFGRWTVTSEPFTGPGNDKRVKVLCECGTERSVRLYQLIKGKSLSCGCLSIDATTKRLTTHGLTDHPLYSVWRFMKHRCSNPNSKYYHNYGGRGISVCDEWEEFKPFYDWAVANGWTKGTILDREDNDGNYTPENCRFVDAALSIRNQRLIKANNTSGYRGVSFRKDKNRYRAYINISGKTVSLGSFKTAKEAAIARDAKAKELNMGHPLNFKSSEGLK